MPSSVQVLLAILSCKRFFILKIVDDDMGEQDILLKIVDDNNNIFLHLMKGQVWEVGTEFILDLPTRSCIPAGPTQFDFRLKKNTI